MAHEVLWRNDFAGDEVVGQVKQAPQESLVTSNPFFQKRLALAGRLLYHKTTLRADRNNNCVFNHLGLNKAKNFSAEIFHSVRPAQTSACDFATSQMHAFDTRRVDINFEHWLGFRKARDQR